MEAEFPMGQETLSFGTKHTAYPPPPPPKIDLSLPFFFLQEAYIEAKREVDANHLKDLKRKLDKRKKKRVRCSC